MKFEDYCDALHMTHSDIAMHAQKEDTDIHIPRKMVTQACAGEAIPLPAALALCKYFTKQFGRKITLADISDLKTV